MATAREIALERQVKALEADNADLRSRILELERLISRNSKNSHRPPSSDPPGSFRKKARKESSRSAGGQPGRSFAKRGRLPATETQTVRPDTCGKCSSSLDKGEVVKESIAQRIEVQEVPLSVTDFICQTVECPTCKARTVGRTAHGGRGSFLGPRLSSIMAMFSGRFHLSKRQVQEATSAIFGVEVSLGSIINVERRVSLSLSQSCTEAASLVQKAAIVNADETGWREANERAWLWVAATDALAVFQIWNSRGSDSARRLLGDEFSGTLVTDRWGGYNWVPAENRQFCWAHLLRDFQGWEEDGGPGQSYGTRLHALGVEAIRLSKARGKNEIDDALVAGRLHILQGECHKLLLRAKYHADRPKRKTAQRLLSQETCLWRFLERPQVPPTNNHAERLLRQAVLWRKKSLGTASGLGSLFVSRILTTVSSLRLQRRQTLDFLTKSLASFEGSLTGPSLLPETLTLSTGQ